MAEAGLRQAFALGALLSAAFGSACNGGSPPTPAFSRAEVVRSVAGGSACAACAPRTGEAVTACHPGSLEAALLSHREALGDPGVRHDAMVCLYERRP